MIAQYLRDARALVARPGGWTQHSIALDSNNERVDCTDSHAICFCALGALWHVYGDMYATNAHAAEHFLINAMGDWPADFNDDYGRTQVEVVAAYDRAILLAEAEAEAEGL